MKLNIATLLGATLLCGAFAVQAQTTPAPSGERKGPMPEQRQHMKERFKAAHEACKDKSDKRACMTEQFCAKSEDPAKCQARAKEHGQRHAQRMDERQKAAEACTGKRGEELGKCMREQREKSGHGRHGSKG